MKLSQRHNGDELNRLTRGLTAFASFGAMLNADGGYRPSIHPWRSLKHALLADAYDDAQEARGDDRRAFRGC